MTTFRSEDTQCEDAQPDGVSIIAARRVQVNFAENLTGKLNVFWRRGGERARPGVASSFGNGK
jgi:hypothetical protein